MAFKLQIYKVGGAIRDKLLGIDSSDNDFVVVGGTPELMKKHGFIQVGKSFPVFIHLRTKEEFALARIEKKVDLGYNGFKCETENISLEEDLKRRDLTINAIAEDINGNLIDPFNGIQDLKNRIFRNVSNNFRDDPVRVLRLARFQSIFTDFTIAEETKKLILDMKENGELESLTKERVTLELKKVLKKDGNIYIFFETLEKLQVLKTIFPAFENWRNFKKYSHPKSFLQLLAIFSTEIEMKDLEKYFMLSKMEIKTVSKLYFFDQDIFEIKTLMNILGFFRKSEYLADVINLYNFLKPHKKIDADELLKLFDKYRDSGKIMQCIKGKRNSKKILFRFRYNLLVRNCAKINRKR